MTKLLFFIQYKKYKKFIKIDTILKKYDIMAEIYYMRRKTMKKLSLVLAAAMLIAMFAFTRLRQVRWGF